MRIYLMVLGVLLARPLLGSSSATGELLPYVTDLMLCFIDTTENPDPQSVKERGPVTMDAHNALLSSATAILITSYTLAVVLKVYGMSSLNKWHSFELSPDFFLLVKGTIDLTDPAIELKCGLKVRQHKELSPAAVLERLEELDPIGKFTKTEPTYERDLAFSQEFKDIFFTEKKPERKGGQRIIESSIFFTRQDRARAGRATEGFPERRFAFIFNGHGAPSLSIDEQIESIKKEVAMHQGEEEYEDVVAWGAEEIKRVQKLRGKVFSAQEGQIASIMASIFASIVFDFIDVWIAGVLVVIDSCYSGRVLAEMIIQTGKAFERKTKQIVIINGASSGAPVWGFGGRKNKNYDAFLTGLAHSQGEYSVGGSSAYPDFIEAIKPVYAFYDDERFAHKLAYANIPLIKFPGQEWTSTLVKLPSIEHVLAFSRNPHDPLNVRTFFAMKGLEPLILETTVVPFPLVFDEQLKAFPAIIVKIPGDMVIELHELRASSFNLSQVLEAFFSVKDLAENRAFIIDTIKARDDIPGSDSHGDVSFEALLLNNYLGDADVEHVYFIVKKEAGHAIEAFMTSCMHCITRQGKDCKTCKPWQQKKWERIAPADIAKVRQQLDAVVAKYKQSEDLVAKGPLKRTSLTPQERKKLEDAFKGVFAPVEAQAKAVEAQRLQALAESLKTIAQNLQL